MRRNGAVVVDPEPTCGRPARVIHRRDTNRQRSTVGTERSTEFSDERNPIWTGRCPGAPAVGEGELFVVDIDASEVIARRKLNNGLDVHCACRRVSEDRCHLTGGERVDDRWHDVRSGLVGNGHELLNAFVAGVPIDLNRGDPGRVEPERRDVSKRPDSLLKLGQRVVECPVGRPGIERNVRLRCGNRCRPSNGKGCTSEHDGQHDCECDQRRRAT